MTLLLSASSPLRAQDVRFEKYTLDNGLQVILHEDRKLPVATVNVWYYVGSKDEAKGRSGFAHLFEHLMFMGTKRVPGSGFDDTMEAGGGWNNASTSRDRTNYYSVGPSNLLPTLLWLEADRMEDFGKAMTQEKLDKQREVVRNERRQVVEMRPYGKAAEKSGSFLYPPSHPYHTSVIGSHRDLEAATLQDVKDFFATYYVPNNASLVVAGDFVSAEVKPLIAKWFGTIPRGRVVPRKRVQKFDLDTVRRVRLEDRVQFARVSMTWTTPPFYKPGDADMDVLGSVLSTGKSSRLYKRLVYEDKIATSVVAYQSSGLHGSEFQVQVMVRPGVPLAKVEKAVDEEIAKLREQGPTEAEVSRTKANLEYGAVSQLESLRERADTLNRYNFHLGNPGGFEIDRKRYEKVTPTTVRDWAQRMLRPGARLIMHVVPADDKAPDPRGEKPVLANGKPFAPGIPKEFELTNGIRVRFWERPTLPIVRAMVMLDRGAASEPMDKSGVTSLATSMLGEGAGSRTALEFSDALADIGAEFSAEPDMNTIRVTIQSLRSKFDAALQLLADATQRPRFDMKDWERVHNLHVRTLQQQQDSPSLIARYLSRRAFFGPSHPYGRPTSGFIGTCRTTTLADGRATHARLFQPRYTKLMVAGALTMAEAKAALEKAFGSWKNRDVEVPRVAPPAAKTAGVRVFLVDKPQAVQTVIRVMMPGPALGHPSRVAHDALNTVLGGSFTSRLNQNLREKHGFTYGAGSAFARWQGAGIFLASASVQADVTGRALEELMKELREIRGPRPISDEEAKKATATDRQTLVGLMESLSGLFIVASQLDKAGKSFASLQQHLAEIEALDASRVNAIAREVVAIGDACLLLVGSRKRILSELEKVKGLGLPKPIELNLQGERIPGR